VKRCQSTLSCGPPYEQSHIQVIPVISPVDLPRLRVFDPGTRNLLSAISGGKVNYHRFDSRTHVAQMERTVPLPQSEWPRCVRGAIWPSCPTPNEVLGRTLRHYHDHSSCADFGPTVRVSRHDFNNDPLLASAIIQRAVLGVRSDIKIPFRYLGFFRYRWNFLVLTAPRIPPSLARILASVWVEDPYSLWLDIPGVTFKRYLKEKVPLASVSRAARWGRRVLCSTESDLASSSDKEEYEHDLSGSDWS
jgi:hypothetical protein